MEDGDRRRFRKKAVPFFRNRGDRTAIELFLREFRGWEIDQGRIFSEYLKEINSKTVLGNSTDALYASGRQPD